ncbi:MAG TPA: hypothetical protein VK789_04740 [Bryobacteraceae bacterium]|nr:hypothetical protein [Bryobacteraceae bacterium]
MKRLAQSLIGLYPPHWRARYGEEFEALIEDSPPGIRGILDLMKGAIKMRLTVPSFPKLAFLLSIAGLLAGLGVSFVVAPRYVSRSTLMLIATPGSPESDVRPVAIELQQEILSRTSLSAVIHDPRLNLYPEEVAKMPLEDVIEQMRSQDIRISIAQAGSTAMTISFAYRDPQKARNTVQVLVTKLIDANLVRQRERSYFMQARTGNQVDRLEARIAAIEKRLGIQTTQPEPLNQFAGRPEGINLDVLDPPSLPAKPVSPDRSKFMVCGFGSGFAAALVIAVFRRRVPPGVPLPAATA